VVFTGLPKLVSRASSGWLENRMYTTDGSKSLLVWFYFTEGAVRAYSDRPAITWPPGVALCLILFTACAPARAFAEGHTYEPDHVPPDRTLPLRGRHI
jgi:uncharacterized membrane protein